MTQPFRRGDSSFGPVHLPPPGFLSPEAPDLLFGAKLRSSRFRPVAFVLALVAWAAVGCIVLLMAIGRPQPDADNAVGEDQVNLYTVLFQARYLVGVREWTAGMPQPQGGQNVYAETFNAGPIEQRLRYAVLAGELEGPEAALKQLEKLDALVAKQHKALSAEQQFQRRALGKLYADYVGLRYDAPSVSAAEREQLSKQFGWFADLAFAPAGQPEMRSQIAVGAGGAAAAAVEIETDCPAPQARLALLTNAKIMAAFVLGVFVAALGAGFLGFVGLLLFLLLAGMRMLRGGVSCGTSPAGVYIETFALWMAAFIGLGRFAATLPLGEFRFFGMGVIELFSLVVLLWPVLRGVPWRTVCADVGLTAGRQPLLEPAAGMGCYFMSLPILFIAVLATLALTALYRALTGDAPGPDDLTSPSSPSHPIVMDLANAGWLIRLQLLFLASFVAPVVEETMFRGVLYRHLRELTCRQHWIVSVLLGTLVSSFIFAVIHPQGIQGMPALMALAFGFVLAREWRGTLLPGMVAHGFNNAAVMVITLVILGK